MLNGKATIVLIKKKNALNKLSKEVKAISAKGLTKDLILLSLIHENLMECQKKILKL